MFHMKPSSWHKLEHASSDFSSKYSYYWSLLSTNQLGFNQPSLLRTIQQLMHKVACQQKKHCHDHPQYIHQERKSSYLSYIPTIWTCTFQKTIQISLNASTSCYGTVGVTLFYHLFSNIQKVDRPQHKHQDRKQKIPPTFPQYVFILSKKLFRFHWLSLVRAIELLEFMVLPYKWHQVDRPHHKNQDRTSKMSLLHIFNMDLYFPEK